MDIYTLNLKHKAERQQYRKQIHLLQKELDWIYATYPDIATHYKAMSDLKRKPK